MYFRCNQKHICSLVLETHFQIFKSVVNLVILDHTAYKCFGEIVHTEINHVSDQFVEIRTKGNE